MFHQFGKTVTLGLIRLGVSIPDLFLARAQEYVQIKRLLDTLAINCVIDVGANQGQTGKLIRDVGYQGAIFSFEPQINNYSILENECQKDPRWECFQLALGDVTQRARLNVNPDSRAMSSLLDFHHPPQDVLTEMVEIQPLDSIFPSLINTINEPCVFLKIDAEGYDLTVFRGAARSLPQILALQVELFVQPIYQKTPSYLEALREYEQAGFELVHLSPVARTGSGNLVCLNALMRRHA